MVLIARATPASTDKVRRAVQYTYAPGWALESCSHGHKCVRTKYELTTRGT